MRLCVGVLLLSCLPAFAAADPPTYRALTGKIVLARCQMDVCTWFSIEDVRPAGASKLGSLFHTSIKDWLSVHPNASYDTIKNRKYIATDDDYFFCSKNQPAVIYPAPEPGKWLAYPLFPDHNEKIFGYNEGLYVRYWAACHGVSINDVYEAGPRLATALGYATAADQPDDEKPLATPEAALLW